jgi:vancomycin resistance protein YoaR
MTIATAPSLPKVKTGARVPWWLVFAFALGTFAIVLLSGLVLFEIIFSIRVLPGVSVWGIDLSGQTIDQAAQTIDARLAAQFNATPIELTDADQVFVVTPIDLGVRLDARATAQAALNAGRNDADSHFDILIYGIELAPQIVIEPAAAHAYLDQLAAKLNRAPIDAGIKLDGFNVIATPSQAGRALQIEAVTDALFGAARSLKFAGIALPFKPLSPQITDTSAVAGQLQSVLSSNFTLQLENPAPNEATSWDLTPQQLIDLIQIQHSANGAQLQVTFDAEKLKAGLIDLAKQINREPQDALFTFNDDTQQLDVIRPGVIGRSFDITTTLDRMSQALSAGQHRINLAVTSTSPEFGDDAKAADLGITQLIASEATFYAGSSTERATNIAAAASKFHGIIIKPGEVFSFDKYLGDVSLDTGFAEALIIANGRTIKGVGGGVCQVSTTAFRAAFSAGFPIIERWPHAYRVGWYERGFGPGLDATVFSPEVDFKFKNDTPYHLLIEAYPNGIAGRLTFKFYSTSDGRKVDISTPIVENVVPHGPDIFEDDPTLPEGEKKQVDYAVDGADVTVKRTVTLNGSVLSEDTIFTHYFPWQAVYKVGVAR